MKNRSLNSSPNTRRVFVACLLTFAILITPFAAMAGRREPGVRSQEPARQKARASQSTKATANETFANPAPAMPAASPVITASMSDALVPTGNNGDGKADPGDTIIYTATISNTGGASATGLTFSDTLDSHTTVSGTLNVSPLAGDDSYDTIGNTLLEVGPVTSPANTAKVTVNGNVLSNDSEFLGDTFALTKLQAVNFSGGTATATTAQSGSVTMDSAGKFSYTPAAGFTGDDTFTYTISDDGTDAIAGNADDLTSVATVTIHVNAQKVWYVNNSGGAGNGTSTTPFNTLVAAQTASAIGDTIYVFNGNNTTSGQNAGITLKANQRLVGNGVQLDVPVSVNGGPNPTVLRAAGSAAQITNTAGNTVTVSNIAGVSIRGFSMTNGASNTNGVAATFSTAGGGVTISNNSIAGGSQNAIDITTTSTTVGGCTATISNNTISAATLEGIDINGQGTGGIILALDSETVTSTGDGINIDGSTGGVTLTSFANNSITGSSGANGVKIVTATFDSNPGVGGLQALTPGTLTIGAAGAGNGVGGNGLVMFGTLTGTLPFTTLSVFADNGRGIDVTGSGVATTGFTASSGATISATNGAAVSFTGGTTIDLQNAVITSTNSPDNGVNLSGVNGTFSAVNTSSITNAGGDDFAVGSGTANITWNATLNNSNGGNAVDVTGHTGGTVSFTGAITDTVQGINLNSNTGATISFSGGFTLNGTSAVFVATGGGTVNVTGTNTIGGTTPATGPAINIANTTIGASGVTLQKVSSTGGTNGIILNTTGATAGLTITGTGTTGGSGGTIQNATNSGIKITSAKSVTLSNMNLTSNASTNGTTNTACGNNLVAGDTTGCSANLYLSSVSGGASLTNLTISGSNQEGIAGTSVGGFTLANSTINNNGNEDYEDGFLFKNLSGAVSITNTIVRDNFSRQSHIYNDTGTMNMTVSGSRFGRNTAPGVSSQQGMLLELAGTSTSTVDMGTSTIDNNGNGNGLAISVTGSATLGSSGTHSSMHNMTSLTNNAAHIFMSTGGTATAYFDTLNNSVMTAAGLQSIDYFAPGGTLHGAISNNVIGTNNVAASGCATALGGCDGMTLDQAGNGAGSGTMVLSVTGNIIQQVNTNGIELSSDFSNALQATITGNTIRQPSNSAAVNSQGNAFFLNIGVSSNSVSGSTACITFTGNTIQDTASKTWDINGSAAAVFAETRHNAITRFPGAAGSGTVNAKAYIDGNNTFNIVFGGEATSLVTTSTGGTFVNGAACSAPLMLAQGGVEAALTAPTMFDTFVASSLTNDSSLSAGVVGAAVSPSLTQTQLDSMTSAAIDRWTAAGLTPEQLKRLSAIRFMVADLSADYLGESDGNTVLVDRSGRGKGWFVDATPQDDSEFGNAISATRRYTDSAGAPAGHVDLLTAIEHEMGHKLGLDDSYAQNDRDSIMYGYLTVGERRTPAASQAKNARPGAINGTHFLSLGTGNESRESNRKLETPNSKLVTSATAPMPSGETVTFDNGGSGITLPAGKSITIVFKATLNDPPNVINNPYPTGGPQVSTQGTVSGSNFTSVLTDDPAPPVGPNGATDPTVTLVDLYNSQTQVVTSGTPSFQGDSVTFTATVSVAPAQPGAPAGPPTGTVTFKDGATPITCDEGAGARPLNGSGVAVCTTSALTAATHTINADYNGDGNFDTSTNSVQQVVNACTNNPVVTTTADSGAGSLRDAITSACTNSTITFDTAGAFSAGGTITIDTELLINRNLTIQGPSSAAQHVTVTRNNAMTNVRIFNLQTGKTATIKNLSITNGSVTGGANNGGGILNSGTLTLVNDTVSGNASASDGGGISNEGTLTIVNSTLSGNTASADGGAVRQSATATSSTLINTTISGNSASGSGGGVMILGGTLTTINTTVTGNTADSDNNSLGDGGGLRVQAGTAVLHNTIVAGNLNGDGGSGTPDDISGSVSASSNNNLIGDAATSGGLTDANLGNIVGVGGTGTRAINTILDTTLGNNGGVTLTHKLVAGSPAIEAGANADLPTDTYDLDGDANTAEQLPVDQRGSGFPRVADSSDANTTQTVDIGAYEAHPTIEDIADTSTNEDTIKNVTFNLGDDTGTLITGGGGSVLASSSNTTLVPNANLSFSGSGGSRTLQITPAADQSGTTTITVTVTATNGRTAVDSFMLTVNAVNDPPNVTGETIGNIAEDCASGCTAGKYVIPFSTLLANDNAGPADEQGSQTISITNVGSAVGGTVGINGTNVEFIPTADYNGAASFQYTVTDNGTPPASGNATASFTITEVNDPPVATDDSLAGISEDCASGCTAGKYVIPFATLTGNDSKGPANESTQTLTITLVNNAVGGTVGINGTNVEFTPTANFNGTASFDYTVQDNGTTNTVNDFKTDSGSVSFPVTAIADTPSVTNSSTNEDTQTTTGLVITRNLADGAEVTHFKITNITNGSLFKNDGTTPISNNQFITVAEGGAGLKFTPTANFSGIGSFDVAAATDGSGSGLSGTATAQITVGSIGDVPGVTNATTNEDTQTSSGLVITKNAADGVDITVFKITNITNGTLFQNNGTTPINNNDFITIAQGNAGLKFTPSANLYSSVSTFSFDAAAAKDNTGAGLGNSATATITVNPIADTPSVSPNPATTAIDTQTGPLVISRNAADSVEVTHFKITNITNGTLYQNDGTTAIADGSFITFAQGNAGLKFTPAAGLSSPGNLFKFDVQASLSNTNGGLGGSAVTENITVSCTDPQVVTSLLDDGSAGTLRYAIANSCPTTGSISFNLPAGPQTITLGSTLTISKTLSITGPANQSITINGNGSRVFDITGGSPTIAQLTVTGAVVSGSNGGGLRNSGTGTITLNAMTFTGNSADNGGAIALTAGTIIINNSTISGNTSNTDGGGVWVNGGTLTLLNDTITNNTATAGQGGGLRVVSGTANVRNTIIAGNTATTNANVGGTINDLGNNLLSGNPKLGPLANNGGPTMTHALLAGSPALDAGDNTAAASLTTDQRGNTFGRLRDAGSDADTTQTVDIGAFEADPSIEDIADKSTNEDTALPSFNFNVGDSFSAFDSITATSSNTTLVPNANISLTGSGSTRSLAITPAADQNGTTTITVTATKTISGTAVSMSDTFVLTVNSIVDTPSVTNATTNEDTQSTTGLVITKNAADGAEVTHFKITNITGGTLFKNNGTTAITNNSFITLAEGNAGLKFTPTANSIAAGSFQVQSSTDATGTQLSTGSATATITIVPIADTPSATNATTNEDTQTSSGLVLSRNAADGAEVTHFKITAITNGTLFKNDGTTQINNGDFITFAEGNAGLRFTPAANLFSPTTSFSFTVQAATSSGGAGLSSGSATATITVNSVNDVPSFTKGADQTVTENAGAQTVPNWATNISAGPSNESGQTLTFQVTGNTNPGLFSAAPAISSTGTLTYTPANNVAGTAQITINLKDNGGTSNGGVDTSATQSFNITVNSAGFINFSASNYNVNENVGSASVIVNRAGDTTVAMTVDYATSDGTAQSRSDYNTVLGTLRFEVGDTQKTIMIPITQDAFTEGPEGFTVTLSNPTGTGVNLVTPSTATVTISDSASPTPNAIDDNEIFVRQHYHDFLNREADPSGLAFWLNGLNACNDPGQRPPGQTQAHCLEVRRILTSSAFFLSIEFMQSGTFVRNVYVASLDRPATGNMPAFNEWLRDTQAVQRGVIVGQGSWQATLDANRLAFINDFVMRPEFVGLYPTTDTPTQYVDKLYAHAGVSPANPGERNQAIAEFGGAATASDPGARGRALVRITQNTAFRDREFPRAFVQMEYFGYLRRNPNDPPDNNFNGYNFWVNKLIQFNNDFFAAEMVKAFLTSSEYRSRFGP